MMTHLKRAARSVAKHAQTGVLVAGTVAAPMAAHAQASAQPDASDATTYIAAGVATVLGVFGAKYGVKAAILIARWVQGVIGR